MKLGLILNPLAGIGGPAGLKGSDGSDTVKEALARGSVSKVEERVSITLSALLPLKDKIQIVTVAGKMGAEVCKSLNWPVTLLDCNIPADTDASHTRAAVRALQSSGLDLLVFAGGDGTARDIFDAVNEDQSVLGIPCGVKMHSSVFANNPSGAAKIIELMAKGELVTVMHGEVRDIDERSFRKGIVQTRYYGELWVPAELRHMQQVKSAGQEVEALVVDEIAAEVIEHLAPEITYFIGSGSTTGHIMETLGLDNTLLGVDVIRDGVLLLADAHEGQLFDFAGSSHCKIVITPIGGQGHLLGRGNQQLSPRVIKLVGLDNLIVVAAKSKLEALPGGILVDSGDVMLDQALSGYIRVITGYEDTVLCAIKH